MQDTRISIDTENVGRESTHSSVDGSSKSPGRKCHLCRRSHRRPERGRFEGATHKVACRHDALSVWLLIDVRNVRSSSFWKTRMRKCDEEEEGKETRWRKHPEGGTNNRRAPLVPHSNQRRTSADCLMMKFHRLFHPQRCGEPVAKIQKAKVPAQLSAWSEVMQVAWALEKGKGKRVKGYLSRARRNPRWWTR